MNASASSRTNLRTRHSHGEPDSASSLYLRFQYRDRNHGAVGATTDCLTLLRPVPPHNDRRQQLANAHIRGIVIAAHGRSLRPDIARVCHFQARPGLPVKTSRSRRGPPIEKSYLRKQNRTVQSILTAV